VLLMLFLLLFLLSSSPPAVTARMQQLITKTAQSWVNTMQLMKQSTPKGLGTLQRPQQSCEYEIRSCGYLLYVLG
jgi:hypothetical protein